MCKTKYEGLQRNQIYKHKNKKICGTVKYVLLSALNNNVATSIATFEW